MIYQSLQPGRLNHRVPYRITYPGGIEDIPINILHLVRWEATLKYYTVAMSASV